jgi:ubiquinone/menaquinone biosynthesis C-methylase UbiE
MAVRQDTIFERFLAPVFRLMIDQDELRRFSDSIDWQAESDRFRNPNCVYPAYYSSQNFHGIEGGYLNPSAAVTYDPITQYVLPPNETWVRQGLIEAIQGYPRRILDLGCGTGSTTLMLKQAFPQAEVIGADLSPYMLVVADIKARKAGLNIQWMQANAEHTGWPDASFDLVIATLLFHETPPIISRAILRECYRLLKVGGEVITLDGNQQSLRQSSWLSNIFEEPYIQDYAAESVDAWMGAAGFGAVQTREHWWLHQVSRGVKPLFEQASKSFTSVAELSPISEMGLPAPAYGT